MTEIGHEPIDYRSMVHAVAVAVTFSRKNDSNPGSRAVTHGDHITNLRYFKDPFGNRYFRRNSSSVSVGAFGPKKEPEKAKTAQLKLVRFPVDASPMETVLNTQATTVRAQMKDEGNDARICSSAYVVVSAALGQRFATATEIK